MVCNSFRGLGADRRTETTLCGRLADVTGIDSQSQFIAVPCGGPPSGSHELRDFRGAGGGRVGKGEAGGRELEGFIFIFSSYHGSAGATQGRNASWFAI